MSAGVDEADAAGADGERQPLPLPRREAGSASSEVGGGAATAAVEAAPERRTRGMISPSFYPYSICFLFFPSIWKSILCLLGGREPAVMWEYSFRSKCGGPKVVSRSLPDLVPSSSRTIFFKPGMYSWKTKTCTEQLLDNMLTALGCVLYVFVKHGVVQKRSSHLFRRMPAATRLVSEGPKAL